MESWHTPVEFESRPVDSNLTIYRLTPTIELAISTTNADFQSAVGDIADCRLKICSVDIGIAGCAVVVAVAGVRKLGGKSTSAFDIITDTIGMPASPVGYAHYPTDVVRCQTIIIPRRLLISIHFIINVLSVV